MRPRSDEEKNSAVIDYIQLGQLDASGRASLLLLLRLLKQPFFYQLRTQQQLGYVVHSGEYTLGKGVDHVHGVYFQILSKSHTPPKVQRAVDEFMAALPQLIADVSAEDFSTARTALVTRLLEPERTLSEAQRRRWAPIESEELDWTKTWKLAEAMRVATQAQVVAAAEALKSKAWVLVHFYGNPHLSAFDEDDGSGAAAVEDVEKWRKGAEVWPEARERLERILKRMRVCERQATLAATAHAAYKQTFDAEPPAGAQLGQVLDALEGKARL